MTDLWSFLLQTLTASGAAVLLLIVKAMFRDKLPPRWQLAAWSLLAVVLLVPAGTGGRYSLVNWPWFVETLKTVFTGEYGTLVRVTAPIPLPRLRMPETAEDWVYAVYAAGAALLLLRYAVSYLRLRRALRHGEPASPACMEQLAAVAERYGLPVCRAVEVPGLRTAFICGLLRPVLALPKGERVDDKVLLHELLHLKHKDVLWGLGICLFRCLHWCNPLLWYCADRAGNDVEACCDQRVLEKLEGEERRDYGRILLSMADEKYARTPGTSSMANGGKNIRRRIEAIARFKRYPAGMALVSVCVLLVLVTPLVGTRAMSVYNGGGPVFVSVVELPAAMASARTTWCTTYAGAMDAYAKAVLEGNALYRAMCAPLSEQEALMENLKTARNASAWPPEAWWNTGLPDRVNPASGYYIYNLQPLSDTAYEGLLVMESAEGKTEEGLPLICQTIRAEDRDGRWVVLPQEDFWTVYTSWGSLSRYSCDELPAWYYDGEAGDFTIRLRYQTTHWVDSYVENSSGMSWLFGNSSSFDTTPQPNAAFTAYDGEALLAIYNGEENKKLSVFSLGVSCAPLRGGESTDEKRYPGANSSGSSSGGAWGSRDLSMYWEDEVWLCGGGSSGEPAKFIRPEGFSADLYLNGQKAAETTLLPVEGGVRND